MAEGRETGAAAVTDEMRERFRQEAEEEYGGLTAKEAEKELKRLDHRQTPWEWLKARVKSFFNMVKMATMSVFLGRAATEKRIAADEKQNRIDSMVADVKKNAKMEVLHRILEEKGAVKDIGPVMGDEENTYSDEPVRDADPADPAKDGTPVKEETEKETRDPGKGTPEQATEKDKEDPGTGKEPKPAGHEKDPGDAQPGKDGPAEKETKPVKETGTVKETKPGKETPPGKEMPGKEPKPGKETPPDKDTGTGKDSPAGKEAAQGTPTVKDGPVAAKTRPGTAQEMPQTEKKSQTVFAEQTRKMTAPYRNGLLRYLEQQTGISKDYIDISNYHGKYVRNSEGHVYSSAASNCIRVTFGIDSSVETPYRGTVTIDAKGNAMEDTEIARAVRAAVLYYTAEVYRESKNNTRFPGTVPDRSVVENFVDVCVRQSKSDMEKGIRETENVTSLFGHDIVYRRSGEENRFYIDRNEVELAPGVSAKEAVFKALSETIRDREHGDYSQNAVRHIANELHKAARESVPEEYYAKYTAEEITGWLAKEYRDFTKEGSTNEKTVYFQNHPVTMTLDEEKKIDTVRMDGVPVYESKDGRLNNSDIAKLTVDPLIDALSEEKMYEPGAREAMIDNIVSKLDENGHLVGYDNESARPDNGISAEESLETVIELRDVGPER